MLVSGQLGVEAGDIAELEQRCLAPGVAVEGKFPFPGLVGEIHDLAPDGQAFGGVTRCPHCVVSGMERHRQCSGVAEPPGHRHRLGAQHVPPIPRSGDEVQLGGQADQ